MIREEFSALEIAKYIIYKFNTIDIEMNNYILQGILYNIQKACLEKYNKLVFVEEFYTTKFDVPIIKDVYYYFIHWTGLPIYCEMDKKTKEEEIPNYIKEIIINVVIDYFKYIDKNNIFDYVYDISKKEAYRLAYDTFGPNTIIPYELIKNS